MNTAQSARLLSHLTRIYRSAMDAHAIHYRWLPIILAGFCCSQLEAASQAHLKAREKSTVLDGWAQPLPPSSNPLEFVTGTSTGKKTAKPNRAGGAKTDGQALMAINPDPGGTGIVYSQYADSATDIALINLAENLGHDPIRIYEWVRNNVRTEFYFGSKRGASLAFLERAGNDIDQCALLGALFKASGYTPTYRLDWLWIPRTASGANQVGVYEWLGVDNDASALELLHLIDSGAFAETDYNYWFALNYMWVSINIPGRGEVEFVPSIKPHSVGRKPNLDSLTGYSLSGAVSAAGAYTTGAYSPSINSVGLRNYLSTLATQASNAVHASSTLHDMDGAELAQRPVIVPEIVTVSAPTSTAYPAGLSFTETTALSGIPVTYEGHFRVILGTYSRWFELSELAGQPLACEFDGAGTAILCLGGAEIARESMGGPSNYITIQLSYESPIAFQAGNSVVYDGSSSVQRQNAVAIAYGMGSHLGRLQKSLQDVSAKETVLAANVTLTDRLQIITQQYLSQCEELTGMAANALRHNQVRAFNAGLGYLSAGKAIVDIKLNLVSWIAKAPSAPSTASTYSALCLTLGALEGTAIEQMSGQRSFGTPTLFDYAMTQGRGYYLIDSVGQLNQLVNNGSLQNYNDTTLGAEALSTIQSKLTAGEKIVLLSNSDVSYGGASFGGYYEITSNGGVGTNIKGALGGVSASGPGTQPVAPGPAANPTSTTTTAQTHGTTATTDPVDLSNGAFLKNDVDLVLGDGSEPNGLRLERQYNSARRLSDPTGLGRGFTHNYNLKLTMRHPSDIDSSRVGVDEVLPILIATRVAQDALASESSARSWQLATTAISWAVDQMLNSRASIALGSRSIEFVRRPDGSYTPPANLTATLTKQGDGSHDLAFRHGNTIHFRASDGKFTSIVDQYSNTLTAQYDGSNRLSTVTDSYSRSLTFAYDGSGRLYQINDNTSPGRSVQYGRDGSGNFTFTDAAGKTQRLEMNSDYLLTRIVDARGRTVVENDYDFWKRVWQQRTFGETNRITFIGIAPGVGLEQDPTGGRVRTYFDARGRKIFVVDQLSQLSQWHYDGVDRLTDTVTPRGAITSYAYDANHVLISETNPLGHTRTITYDSQSRPVTVRNFEGQETLFTYTDRHQVASITAPGGIVTTYTYDTRGRVQEEHPAAYAAGSVNTYSYDGFGNVDTVTYPGVLGDNYDYDARGDLTQLIDRKGVKTTYEYNARRQRTAVTQWEGTTARTTETVYDDAGDVDYTLDASGRKIDTEHDAMGHMIETKRGPLGAQVVVASQVYDTRNLLYSSTDALGNGTTFAYDAAQRLATVTDPLSRVSQLGYDADGHVTTRTSPLGFVTTDIFDSRGLLDATVDADDTKNTLNRTVDFGYDKDGRRTSLANRLNKAFTWTFNDAARTVSSTTPTGKTTTTVASIRGLPETVTEPSGQTTSFTTYDAEGRLTQKTDGVGTTTTTTYTYWPNGLPQTVSETVGGTTHTTTRTYDDLNRLVSYEDGEDHTIAYGYHPSGELATITYPGNKTVTYAYDDFGRLHTVTDWASRVTTYTYDNASRLTRIGRPNGTYRTQEYDAAGQLLLIKEYKSDNTVILYQELRYDNDGRVTYSFLHPKLGAVNLAQDTLLYDYDNRLATWNGQGVTFDADGNMTSGPLPSGTFGTYTYDARNRLTSASDSIYRYNPDGLRVQITGTGAATFVVDPNAALSRTLIRTKGTATTYYVYGLGLLYEETAGATKTYHYNHQGSTVALTDSTGSVTERWSYTPFGAIAAHTDSTGTPISTPTDTPFLLHGELGVMTDASGLNYMRARYYNPRLMRFCNADPIGFSGGLNHYAFCGNDPISYFDPLGLADIGYLDGGTYLGHSDFYMGDRFDWNRLDREPMTAPGATLFWGHEYLLTELHFLSPSQAMAWIQQSLATGNLREFERAMHAAQDVPYHYNQGYRYVHGAAFQGYGHGFASALDFVLPYDQNPDNNPKVWPTAEAITQTWVPRWIERWGLPPLRNSGVLGPIYGEGMRLGAPPIKLDPFVVTGKKAKKC